MPTDNIVALLIAERDRLNRAIEMLGGSSPVKRRGRPPKNPYDDPTMPDWVKPKSARQAVPKKRGRKFTAKQRKEQAARMQKYWAAKKRG